AAAASAAATCSSWVRWAVRRASAAAVAPARARVATAQRSSATRRASAHGPLWAGGEAGAAGGGGEADALDEPPAPAPDGGLEGAAAVRLRLPGSPPVGPAEAIARSRIDGFSGRPWG